MGPTASGKTGLAEALADRLGAVLLNADAFQIYRGLDIGTAKPEDKSRYRLLDLREPNETFGVGEWVQLAQRELEDAYQSHKDVVMVGGTGLYIRALMEQYDSMQGPPDPGLRAELNARLEQEGLPSLVDELKLLNPAAYETVDRANPARVIRAIERARTPPVQVKIQIPAFQRLKFAIDVPSTTLQGRIENRVRQMVQNGWSLEIEGLRKKGFLPTDPGLRAIGYRSMWRAFVVGDMTIEEAIEATALETRRYAKRQRTWLRSEPNLNWLSASPGDDPWQLIMDFLAVDLT